VVVVTGGYAGLAAGVAAGLLRVPLVLEEPNAVPGRATKLLMPFARFVATALVAPESRIPKRKIVDNGYPIRPEITQGSAEAARERWNLKPGRPVLMVYGGSQGARSINQAVRAALPKWLDAGIQVLHSAGLKLYDEAVQGTEEWQDRGYRPVPYIEGMGDAYAVADLVVCRGGATSIVEAAACGKPMLIVPYPHHTDRHQYLNAGVAESAGAGIMVENSVATTRLPDLVLSLMADEDRRARMAEASRGLGRPDAARVLAEEILKVARG
jgi:UDP-N-acetylglucosamine--N-acetylmuramyl-(pentapeptide) pyrophosphoryl-undecaprenol N-acetylglucosamine transferase